jgi:5,10-methylenetetrahydrofolate reductase
MSHGPCAGVGADLRCEVPGAGRCPYLDVPDCEWPYARTPPVARPAAVTVAGVPLIVADLPAPALDAGGLRGCAAELAGSVDAALIGEPPGARVQFPPSYRVRLLADAGVPAWAGINCRDRNRAALEGEIAACLDAGAVGLHCVTGDHPGTGNRPDAAPVFDLDSVELVALARDRVTRSITRAGRPPLCSVAHAPAAPPGDKRLRRALAKISAGADAVFIDHCGGPAQVAAATAALRDAGFAGVVLACVPLVTSKAAAEVIESFAGDRLPPGYLEAIGAAEDPEAAGVMAATGLATAMLAAGGVDGVNLSGGTRHGEHQQYARAMAEVGRAVREAAREAVPATERRGAQ